MYCYYEHHRDGHGKIVLTELRLSSNDKGKLFIAHKNSTEALLKSLCVNILKWPPIEARSMDEKIWVWSYFGQYGVSSTYGEEVLRKLQQVTKPIKEIGLIEVHNLAAQCVNNFVNLTDTSKMKAEEFFYNHNTITASPTLTKEQIQLKLKTILGTDTLDKSSYRRAALRLHPDRNNGDGSSMSELNMLWGMYNA